MVAELARAPERDPGSDDAGLHPAVGPRHRQAGRLHDAPAGSRQSRPASSRMVAAAARRRRPTRHPASAMSSRPSDRARRRLYVDVDRDKAQMLNVPLVQVFEPLRVYLGSSYVNDFNMFGRTFRVVAQAERISARSREHRADPRSFNAMARWCRSARSSPSHDRRPRPHAALQPVPDRRGATGKAAPASVGRRRSHHGRTRRARAARRRRPSSGRTCPIRRSTPAHRLLRLRALGRSSCSWRCPRSMRVGRCRSPSS